MMPMPEPTTAIPTTPGTATPGATTPGTAMPASSARAFKLVKPVFFVGFMGAGKTSVARRVARMCSIASIDMDTYLERRVGKEVKDIFAKSGERTFRALESEVLKDLAEGEPHLISCGGGIVLQPENREILKARGYVVYLKVSADKALERIGDTSTRPLLKDIANARRIHEERAARYEEVSDISIDTEGKGIVEVAREVKEALLKEGIL